MHPLLEFLNSLPAAQRDEFAARCGTSVGYLRKAISSRQTLGEALCINIERESVGKVRCEQLRPKGVDWAFLRGTRPWNPATHPVSRDEQRRPRRDPRERPGDVVERRKPQQPNERPDPRRAARRGCE